MLGMISDTLGCDTPEPSNPFVCGLITKAYDALGCTTTGPPTSCLEIGCDDPVNYFCDTPTETCLLKKTSGNPCVLNKECLSSQCEDDLCL